MSHYDNLLASKDRIIDAYRIGLMALAAVTMLGGILWLLSVRDITLHYPPDLHSGAVMGIDDIPKANVYTFAYYIFQQLNRWPRDGARDYYERIYTLRSYLTPSCFEDRLSDYKNKAEVQRILLNRERAIWEIPGRGYKPERVKKVADSRWTVSLDLHISETHRGEQVKDLLVNYPLAVVRYDVDPETNPWGLAIDCFAGTPTTIEQESL